MHPPLEPKVPTTVYLPLSLRRLAELRATGEGRTLSNWIVRVLYDYLKIGEERRP